MRKMLFLFVFLSIASISGLLFVTGCATDGLAKEKEYLLDGANISFTLSNIWEEEINTTHDLSLTKLDSNLQFSVYKKSEINMTAEELLNKMIKAELMDSDSKSLIKKYNVNETRKRIIYSKLYSATKDNVEQQYLFSVIDFDDSDTLVFAVYKARGSYMTYGIDDIQRLLIKMEWNGPKTELAYN